MCSDLINVFNLGYIVIGESEKTSSGTKYDVEDLKGYRYRTYISTLLSNKKNPIRFGNKNPHTMHNIDLWCKLNSKYSLVSGQQFVGVGSKLLFICPIHGEFDMTFSSLKSGQSCGYCSNRRVKKGFNDVATTDP